MSLYYTAADLAMGSFNCVVTWDSVEVLAVRSVCPGGAAIASSVDADWPKDSNDSTGYVAGDDPSVEAGCWTGYVAWLGDAAV